MWEALKSAQDEIDKLCFSPLDSRDTVHRYYVAKHENNCLNNWREKLA
jgi:hypothetical protein